ncbi:hypothetical protein [Streptomyces marincola]|uniref:hypothetical protein n=1 Tax=Streptomyces marincola TaxID=2878388 RepID=UPI001CF199C1|nr:hypothetical protein [Streptomyces marincola]UCM89652.1 hypothetical protein LC193_17795 [Streptomyces marincola]
MTHLSRAIGLAGLSAGAVLASASGAAAVPVAPLVVPVVLGSAEAALDPALDLQLHPLADTTTDPLANTVETQVADFQPVSTGIVTGPLTEGASARELPGAIAAGLLGGLPVKPAS